MRISDLWKRISPIKNLTGQKAKQVHGSGVMHIWNLVRVAFPFPVVINVIMERKQEKKY